MIINWRMSAETKNQEKKKKKNHKKKRHHGNFGNISAGVWDLLFTLPHQIARLHLGVWYLATTPLLTRLADLLFDEIHEL
jgi:hypothetical protein